jgi:hypothetical protein
MAKIIQNVANVSFTKRNKQILPPLPQHLAFALTEPTFGKKAGGKDAGAE